ncbi:hypothetical protein COCON_G00090080 [Conger conger]|uniref:Uncharacterized protein n=1 Tax=Conger conger TaxID=82655 RepID=A0A9Q1DKX9_CONCO|nr:hypothetical protein COCON_G00090080 [Conger conger]
MPTIYYLLGCLKSTDHHETWDSPMPAILGCLKSTGLDISGNSCFLPLSVFELGSGGRKYSVRHMMLSDLQFVITDPGRLGSYLLNFPWDQQTYVEKNETNLICNKTVRHSRSFSKPKTGKFGHVSHTIKI